jgi:GntR family transcriptional repressor for pyruvate dehydrogenase complex
MPPGKSVSETVTEHIVALINSGKYRPGERLPSEQQLMEDLKVGRSSVREAIRGLAMMGIVQTKRRGGTIITSPVSDPFAARLDSSLAYWAVHDLFVVRRVLEGLSASLAAKSATPEEIETMKALAGLMARKNEVDDEYAEQNTNFHLRIAMSSRNPILFYCLSNLINSLREVRRKFNRHLGHMRPQDAKEHLSIVEAIEKGKPELAARRMQAHIDSYLEQLRKLRNI